MWIFDNDYNKWISTDDKLSKDSFDYYKEELSSVRFYSKCLSGATYLPVNDLNNIYDVLGNYKARNWYIGVNGSPYTNTLIPYKNATEINATSSYDYYTKYLGEYGLTLKSLFTSKRLIDDSINYIYVDVATTEQLYNIGQKVDNFTIDGVRLTEGSLVLVKNQITSETLPNTVNPDDYFISNYTINQNFGASIEYYYYNELNGIYIFKNGILERSTELDNYDNCKRFSVAVKDGGVNSQKQFHLSRLLNGYYPTTSLNQPIEFIEKKNWLLRNKVDYNNLFEINYHDVIKHPTQSYYLEGVTYSIPERLISVGEFGVIINHQSNVSNIIKNKYKVNLRSISQTSTHYWICGDSGLLIKVRKHDFNIEKVQLKLDNNFSIGLKSISFYNDLRGVVVGDLNTIYITNDGGLNWNRLRIRDFDPYYFNKVVFRKPNVFYIAGNGGVFIEMKEDISGWTAYRRRISKSIDDEDEYLLVDNINDLYYTNINSWNLDFNYSTQSIDVNKEMLFLVTDDSKVIVYDINDSISQFDFVYLDLNNNYGDILNISRREGSNSFYFTGIDVSSGKSGIFEFNLSDFNHIGIGNSYSNTILSATQASYISDLFPNEIFDYNGSEMLICGNNSLFKSATYSFNFVTPDTNFEKRLKSKLLFLDYDAGSKLNFFTDFGDYRLPNSVTFSESYAISSSGSISFNPLVISATFPSYMTQSETNWWEYWTDREKTFEFYSSGNSFTESTKVVMSSTFSYSPTQSFINIGYISSTSSVKTALAPNVGNGSRFNGIGGSIYEPISAPNGIYLYDYLMILKTDLSYPVSVGDVMNLNSQFVDGKFTVNKIFTGTSGKYIYMFTEFNENIINNLLSSTASIVNLNRYSTTSELSDRFNSHPISNGYELLTDSVSNEVQINPVFNYYSSYYNLATNVNVTGNTFTMSYTSGFMDFGYTPTYNILSYLEGLNNDGDPNPLFNAQKEYYSMPEYRGIPLQGIGGLTDDNVYLNPDGITFSYTDNLGNPILASNTNKLLFGKNLKLEWESILINTFVDINLYDGSSKWPDVSPSSTTEKLLVMKKYYDSVGDYYVVEFNKKLIFDSNNTQYWIDIISRRKLYQISNDLLEINNIQRQKYKKRELGPEGSLLINGYDYWTYEKEMSSKLNTDSYAKVLLSDVDTIESLSAVIYSDYKNEISMNLTKLEEEFNIPIIGTGDYSGNLFIFCGQKHGLRDDDSVNLEFNGGTSSSQYLNQNYFGYRTVKVVNEYNFYVDVLYGNTPLTGNDTGFVKFSKLDPFLNFEPVDLIDLGVDKKGKQSIELNIDNLQIDGSNFKLTNVDFGKLRFRLVDGLNIDTLSTTYPWLLEAEISGATIGLGQGGLVWYGGTWEAGRWYGGRWVSGLWISGDWYDGIWDSKNIKDNILNIEIDEKSNNETSSIWYGGRWFGGTWNNGIWVNGRWYDGTWNSGTWYKGIWNDGTWNNGDFTGGIWVLGTWNNGSFNCDNEPSYWLDGQWFAGDFENGMWYSGTFDEKNGDSRFGVNAYNSRTATWHSGNWVKGSFYSRLNINDKGVEDVSDIHKYSIWNTGNWFGGDFYGGVVYNIDWRSGNWHGGILEDIEVIGFGNDGTGRYYFTTNGIFKFNTGDEFTIIDNQFGQTYSIYGSNDDRKKYIVLDTEELPEEKWTKVYVASTISSTIGAPNYTELDTTLRIVSRFRNCNWKSGIWTNGVYEKGLWEGGIWYGGIFEATWM